MTVTWEEHVCLIIVNFGCQIKQTGVICTDLKLCLATATHNLNLNNLSRIAGEGLSECPTQLTCNTIL